MRTNAPFAAGSVLLAALSLAACGADKSPAPASSPMSQGFLFDRAGLAVYTPEQEADGKIRCTGACTSFWKPVRPGQLHHVSARLGTIRRPDGARQVTIDGKPVYTFSEDSPGGVSGDGFSDAFAGRHFTWHAVTTRGAPSAASTGGGY